MRLLHLTDRLTDRGGAYWHLRGVLHALVEAGHDVRLGVGVDEGRMDVPCPVTLVPGLEARARVSLDMRELDAGAVPDVVHVHTVVNPEALEWAAARGAVATVQDHRPFCPSRGKWTSAGELCSGPMAPDVCAGCFEDAAYFREIYALTSERLAALRGMRRLVVLSRYMKRELAAVGLAEDRIAVVPPFVHALDTQAPADGPPCVLFAGRLSATKGPWEALRAWRLSGVDLPLVVAGSGPLRADLEAAGAQVLGWVARDRLAALYRRARAVLMPSRWQEPFGIVGLEALTMGTPVVAWDSGGVSEWHVGPGLVPWGDVEGLARALREAVGVRATAPAGFERRELMRRLVGVYASTLESP